MNDRPDPLDGYAGVPDEARMVHGGILAAADRQRRDRRQRLAPRSGATIGPASGHLAAAAHNGCDVVAAIPVKNSTELRRLDLLDDRTGQARGHCAAWRSWLVTTNTEYYCLRSVQSPRRSSWILYRNKYMARARDLTGDSGKPQACIERPASNP